MSDFQVLLDELMNDPDFQKEYEAIQLELDKERAIMENTNWQGFDSNRNSKTISDKL